MSDEETKPYIVRRVGLRWRIYRVGEDDGGIVRQGRPVAEVEAFAGKDLNDTLRGAA